MKVNAAIENAKTAKLSADGQTAEDNKTTIPFPIVTKGAEVMLNHVMRWRGTQQKNHTMTAAVTESGEFTEQKIDLKIIFPYDQPGERNKINDYFYAETVSPPRTAGDITLVHNFTDPIVEVRPVRVSQSLSVGWWPRKPCFMKLRKDWPVFSTTSVPRLKRNMGASRAQSM